MRIVHGYRGLGLNVTLPALTIGNFDGVHRGHQQVMRAVVDEARRRQVVSIACTFEPHTQHVLQPTAAPPLLQTLGQRLEAIEAVGLDIVVVIPFDRALAETSHESFVEEFLVGEVGVGSLHLSRGFSFGRDKAGNRAYLERRARECGFQVERVPPLVVGGAPVSSTRVRGLVTRGAVAEAATLLARPFAVVGEVVAGAGRGRALDARTANLRVRNGCLPAHGVYLTEARLGERRLASITNIGTRPTFGGEGDTVVETHLLEYRGDQLYGEELEVAFRERIRDEKRFDDAEALRRQIAVDVARARAFFATAG